MTEKDLENQAEKMMPDDEEIIELTDEVPISDEDEVIELTDVVDGEDEVIELTDVVDGEDEVIELTDVVDDEDEVVGLTDRASDSSTGGKEAVSDEDILSVEVTPEQINTALERTIEKLYGQKIESLLVEIVQKKVSGEIEKLKKMILDSSSDN